MTNVCKAWDGSIFFINAIATGLVPVVRMLCLDDAQKAAKVMSYPRHEHVGGIVTPCESRRHGGQAFIVGTFRDTDHESTD
jgi:hypothetical protein